MCSLTTVTEVDVIFFKKMGQPGLFFVYFRSFSNKHQYILQQINVKKCPSMALGFEPTTFRT